MGPVPPHTSWWAGGNAIKDSGEVGGWQLAGSWQWPALPAPGNRKHPSWQTHQAADMLAPCLQIVRRSVYTLHVNHKPDLEYEWDYNMKVRGTWHPAASCTCLLL